MDLSLPIFLAAVFVVNVVPAFMPPTWVLLVYYSLFYCIDPLYLAILAAIASMLGRIALAKWSGPLTYRFFHKSMASNAEYAREECSKHRSAEFFGSFLYALSPLPSRLDFHSSGSCKTPACPHRRRIFYRTAYFLLFDSQTDRTLDQRSREKYVISESSCMAARAIGPMRRDRSVRNRLARPVPEEKER